MNTRKSPIETQQDATTNLFFNELYDYTEDDECMLEDEIDCMYHNTHRKHGSVKLEALRNSYASIMSICNNDWSKLLEVAIALYASSHSLTLEDINTWRLVFTDLKDYMVKPAVGTIVYRGTNHPEIDTGISWSTDRTIAEQFGPTVLTKVVTESNVYGALPAMLMRGDEYEVLMVA